MDWLTDFGPPHLTWLVAALMVQRERQRWHHEVASRDAPPPGWIAEPHGAGVCLVGPDGEVLDVDFNDETGATIDVWFFARRVESLREAAAWLAERRLWRWRPAQAVIVDGLDELFALGAVTRTTAYGNKIALAPHLEARTGVVAAELAGPAAHAGWLAMLEPGGEAAQLAGHRAWLRARLQASARPGDLIEVALAGTSPDEALALCRPLLARADWSAARAIELLAARADVPPPPEIVELLRTASLVDDHPSAPYQACAYLLARGVERALALERFDAWAGIEQVKGYRGHPFIAELAMLALRELPDRALPLVRRALRSEVPMCVQAMAALLAAIDQRWCHRELAAAAAEPRRESHAYLAAALRHTSSELARRRGEAVPGPATRSAGAIGYTFDEVLHASADEWISDEIAGHRALAELIRSRYPEDWGA